MNGNDRSDFWHSWSGNADGREASSGHSGEDRERTEAPGEPAYFRYGPFAPGDGERGERQGYAGNMSDGGNAGVGETKTGADFPGDMADHGQYRKTEDPDVEITVPAPPKPVPMLTAYGEPAKEGGRRKRKAGPRSFGSMFAAFMAGALLVGGLMFAADKANLFTADAAGGSTTTVQQGSAASQSGGGNAGLVNNALDVVRPNSIAEIVANSQAAVVKIETYSKRSTSRSANPFYSDPFFRFFFGDDFNQPNQSQTQQLYKTGEGSGFIFDSEGYILTNQHVVDSADEIRVYVEGYEKYFVAEKLGESYDLDLAALKIKGDAPFAYLPLGDADAMSVGDWVIAIGNPYGFDHTVTVGVLSAKERPITIQDGTHTRKYENLLQTDASINPGNSGGPLLNLNGEVIGINTAVSSQAQGIGFAIPTSTISGVLDNLKNDVPIPKEPQPYIGVYLADLDDTWKQELGYKGDGALVTQVEVGGPAYRAGVRAGDIITEVAGKKTASSQDVIDAVKKLEVGKKINLKIVRSGKTYEAVVTVGDRNSAE